MATLRKLVDELTGAGSMEQIARQFMGDPRAGVASPAVRVPDFPDGLIEGIDAMHEERAEQARNVALTAETLQAMLRAMADAETRNHRYQVMLVGMTALLLILTLVLVLRP